MVQSVEALLAPEVEAAIAAQWQRLAEAGLPSEQRSVPAPHHRPHLTLWAGEAVSLDAEAALPAALRAGLGLTLVVGPVMIFGPRRGRCILVRLGVPSPALLDLQRRVVAVCGRGLGGQFDLGRWVPHVTLARRVAIHQVGAALAAVQRDGAADLVGPCAGVRRWDGAARRDWLLAAD